MSDRTPVIVGIGLSDYPKAPHLDSLGHHTQAVQRALADSGMAKSEIDGFVSAGMGAGELTAGLAEYFGVNYRFLDGTMTGGSSFEYHVQHAVAAIREGMCDTVLITYGSDFLSRMGRTLGTGDSVAAIGCPGQCSTRRRSGTPWSAPTPWRPAATCTSSGRPRKTWRRSQ